MNSFLFRRWCLGLAPILIVLSLTAAGPSTYLKKPPVWFESEQASNIGDNILSWQSELGGWPKNQDTAEKPFLGSKEQIRPTYDNGATTDELRFVAKMYNATRNEKFKKAFAKGLGYVLAGQYANGGWPQFHPPGNNYHRHITFNDNAMVRLMEFTREVSRSQEYDFVNSERRSNCQAAFDRGVQCILKCQIRIDNRLTAWCAQHDSATFQPQSARSYELATISASESVGIVRLLMSIESPTPEIINAVDSAVAWLRNAQLKGIRLIEVDDPQSPEGVDKRITQDPSAPPLWARFYDIETNHPIFCDRDGIPKDSLDQLGYERRNGYAWYGTWPQKLLDAQYPKWKNSSKARKEM